MQPVIANSVRQELFGEITVRNHDLIGAGFVLSR
ncbi:hypothetical protein J2Z31_003522 [Sinorhizobium kostiense]|uniref:Uncharacterized protein n=1 Tax=Sinorhizobium kostiense TaxID=76747 RepID=A0ABS4R281_9HYPH|nr:hypothetical protein [Sinorhizobium kostiense]